MKTRTKSQFLFLLAFFVGIASTKCDAQTPITVSNVDSVSSTKISVTIPYNSTTTYYEISTVMQLRALSKHVMNGNYCSGLKFKLLNDIVFTADYTIYNWDGTPGNESNFLPIGCWSNYETSDNTKYFAGTFEGNNYTINGLKIKKSTSTNSNNYIGLFGFVKNGTVQNVGITNSEFTGYSDVSGVCGGNNGTINQCYVTSSIITCGNAEAGGICGENTSTGYVNNCYVTNTKITGSSIVGGICGELTKNTIKNCYSTALIYKNTGATATTFGGLVGQNTSSGGTITNSYSISTWNQTGVTSPTGLSGTTIPNDMTSFLTSLNNGTTVYRKTILSANNGYPILLSLPINTVSTPYNITSIADLRELSAYVMNGYATTGRYFKQTKDLTFTNSDAIYDWDGTSGNESNFLPIGGWKSTTEFASNINFNGTFDGDNHTINNLTIKRQLNSIYIGLFGTCGNNADIKNIGIVGATLQGVSNIGGISGYKGKITHCYVTSSTLNADYTVGGICGNATNDITNCYVTNTKIKGTFFIGGLLGYIDAHTISNCYSTATITRNSGDDDNFGGLIGYNYGGTINHSYSIDSWNQTSPTFTQNTSSSNGTSTMSSDNMKLLSFVTDYINIQTDGTVTNNYEKDNFTLNEGYPVFATQNTVAMADISSGIITKNMVIPYGYTATTIPTTVTIEDGASLVDNTKTVTTATIKKKMKVSSWNLWGRAQTTQTTADILNTNTHNHDMAAVKYDYTANTWATGDNDYLLTNSTLNIGEGYFVYPLTGTHAAPNTDLGDTYTTVSQTGTIQENDVNITTLNLTNKGNAFGVAIAGQTSSAISGKWFALSNPYMGRIDVRTLCETGLTNEQGEGTVYIYNPDKNRWETPIEIYPSQGFMVASASSTGDITLTGTLSKSQLLGSFNGKKTTTQTTPYSYITFASQANNTTKEAFARITDDASNGFDQRDAYVMLSSNNQDLVEPYFLVDNHSIMKNIFKTMPYYCPINFHASKISDVSFVVSNIPDNVKVSIINVSDSTETALTNGSVFNFIANQGENNGRFVIKFGQNSSSITDNIQSNNNLSIWNNNNEININGYNLKKVEVVNMIGQIVYAKEISGENFKFNLNVNPGAYVVKVKSHNNINQQKIIIK